MVKISFVHSGIPRCSSPIVSYAEGYPEFLGIHGTGFFARKKDQLYFITASHCLTDKEDPNEAAAAAERLQIPYNLIGVKRPGDYVKFVNHRTYSHKNPDIPGKFIDVSILQIEVIKRSKHDKHLRSRAVKLPPNGQWLEDFVQTQMTQNAFSQNMRLPLVTIGYPREGTVTQVTESGEVITQAVLASGNLRSGAFPHTAAMTDVTWDYSLDGFSGSPVFIQWKNEHGKQQALAGMLIRGGNQKTQLIRVGFLTAYI